VSRTQQPDPGEEREAFELAARAEQAAAAGTAQGEVPATPKAPRNSRRPKKPVRVELLDTDQEAARAVRKALKLEQNLQLRFMMAIFAIAAVSVQLVAAGLLFWGYLGNRSWRVDVEPSIMIAFFSATVVEVIGIVIIIAKNLFPSNDLGLSKKQQRKVIEMLGRD